MSQVHLYQIEAPLPNHPRFKIIANHPYFLVSWVGRPNWLKLTEKSERQEIATAASFAACVFFSQGLEISQNPDFIPELKEALPPESVQLFEQHKILMVGFEAWQNIFIVVRDEEL